MGGAHVARRALQTRRVRRRRPLRKRRSAQRRSRSAQRASGGAVSAKTQLALRNARGCTSYDRALAWDRSARRRSRQRTWRNRQTTQSTQLCAISATRSPASIRHRESRTRRFPPVRGVSRWTSASRRPSTRSRSTSSRGSASALRIRFGSVSFAGPPRGTDVSLHAPAPLRRSTAGGGKAGPLQTRLRHAGDVQQLVERCVSCLRARAARRCAAAMARPMPGTAASSAALAD